MALERVTLVDDTGVEVQLVDVGAAVDLIRAPDRAGNAAAITPALPDDARPDPARNPFAGVTIGPFANRLVVDDEVVLHGGPDGWCWKRWAIVDATPTSVVFALGWARVTYELSAGRLGVTLEATPPHDTVLSMTNHTYWNLGGPIPDHELTVHATGAVPVDDQLVPTGAPEALREPVGLPGEYDTCLLIDGVGNRLHARLTHPPSGRAVEVWSDHPALQVYTGCRLGGRQFVALEPQHVPNAPAFDWAPNTEVLAGETYRHRLAFHFRTDGDQQ